MSNLIPGYREYLESADSGYGVSGDTLANCLRHVSDASASVTRRLFQGEVNEVYDVELTDGLAVIVRISKSSAAVFGRERWAIERCAAKGIPVPEILSLSSHGEGPDQIEACIQKKVRGRLLSLYGGSRRDRSRIAGQCGEWLREMHSITTTGFGYLDSDGRGTFSRAHDEAAEYQSLESGLLAAADAYGFERSILIDSLAFVVQTIESRSVEPRLIHNDFEPKHIIVDGNKAKAIIDFGEASGGDPINDLVRFSFCETDPVRFGDVLAGYGECDLTRLVAYRIGFSLFLVSGFHAKGFAAGAIEGYKRIQSDWRKVCDSVRSVDLERDSNPLA